MAIEFVDIKGYENLYALNKDGLVLSKNNPNCVNQYKGENYLKPFERNGYLSVCLVNGKDKKYKTIHRLLAQHFIENPENKTQVNHIDGNKHNNNLENIEWATPSENILHAHKNGLIPKLKHTEEHKLKMSELCKNRLKKVFCENENKVFTNIYEASKFYNINSKSIQAVCLGIRNSVFNKTFKYMEN
jgi:hypothetical protein